MVSVLLIDDEPALLEIGTIFLERSGDFSVTTAGSPGDAVARLEEKRFDAIVTDYTMPDVEGAGFIREIRSRWHEIPIIVLSGRSRDEIAADCLGAGADAVLRKDGVPAVLYGSLAQVIAGAIREHRSRAGVPEC
ncbi:hypothetical protein ABH15_00060 [Methanoculleus taiwanensis]|uniref:Response regulatory domain-containing protein n=1 Tax=Methanoculleus taiwanensis TaxID=1550565 RepID=A0A498H1R4_9EURY|nr:response regulator [Methanoculleus taiwanensis]RXE56623.1 hypothetical protein ABH15_00060 [Methanoculleus taiwanensis]